MLANRSKNKNSNDENLKTKSPFEQFCFDVVEKRIISGEEIFTLKKLFESFFSHLRDKMQDTNFLFGEIGTCSVDSERQHIIYKSNA